MNSSPDAATLALTGVLPFILLVACLLSWPISLGVLAVYRREVRRSMSQRIGPGDVPSRSAPAAVEGRPIRLVEDSVSGKGSMAAGQLARALMRQPWRAAVAYAAGGISFALLITAGLLLASGMEFFPIRFSMLFWIFFWPSVISTSMVAASVRSIKLAIVAAYFAVFLTIGAAGISASTELTWAQVVLLWILYNLPPTILLLTFLARPIRAIGPFVLTFMVVALIGSQVAVSLFDMSETALRALVELQIFFGAGTIQTFFAMLSVGFAAFAVFGWLALQWIRKRYEAKRLSDESVALDAVWILFGVYHSSGFVFEHPLWVLVPVIAVVAYKVVAALAGIRVAAHGFAPRLLLLRSFSIGKNSERLLDAVEKHWRRVGSIQMIAGYDLAGRTIEPHELLDFTAGKLSRRFIDGPETLERRLAERDTLPDADGRYRVNDFFCYDNAWRLALTRLVGDSDVVLMDLRGFSRANAGCVFEIEQLAALVPLAKVIFLVDARTDDALLRETLSSAAARLRLDSPNRDMAAQGVRVFRAGELGAAMVRRLLAELSAATALSSRTALHSSTP